MNAVAHQGVADGQACLAAVAHGKGISQVVAVLIVSAVAVEVAEEVDLIAFLKLDQALGLGLFIFVYGLSACPKGQALRLFG